MQVRLHKIATTTFEFQKAAMEVPWANDTLMALPIPEHLLKQFCVEKTWRDECGIDLSRVKGTNDPDCQGYTWLEFLHRGKRMRRNLEELFSNPGYYFTDEKKLPSMSYLKIGDHFYVHHDGSHRTCIARFLFHLSGSEEKFSGVEVTAMVVDFEAYELWKAFGGPEGLLIVHSMKTSREDGPGWMTERFELSFSLFRKGTVLHGMSKEDLWRLYLQERKGWLGRIARVLSLEKRQHGRD